MDGSDEKLVFDIVLVFFQNVVTEAVLFLWMFWLALKVFFGCFGSKGVENGIFMFFWSLKLLSFQKYFNG